MIIKSAKRSYFTTLVYCFIFASAIVAQIKNNNGYVPIMFWGSILLISFFRKFRSGLEICPGGVIANGKNHPWETISDIQLNSGFIYPRLVGIKNPVLYLKNGEKLKMYGYRKNDAINLQEHFRSSSKSNSRDLRVEKIESCTGIGVGVKQFELPYNPYSCSEDEMRSFINSVSSHFDGVGYLGVFADSITVEHGRGIKSKAKTVIIERTRFSEEVPGEEYACRPHLPRDEFEMPFEIPPVFPSEIIKSKTILTSTVVTHSCSPVMKCSICSGRGTCQSCGGRGTMSCSSCSGTGKTKRSDGRYKNGNVRYKVVSCGGCDGSKRVTCSKCNGSKECTTCSGTGNVICSRCKGTSKYQTYDGYHNIIKPTVLEISYPYFDEADRDIAYTQNALSNDDVLHEWENGKQLKTSNIAAAKEINPLVERVNAAIYQKLKLKQNQRIGKVELSFENVDQAKISFIFEGMKYDFFVSGDNHVVCWPRIPNSHYFSAGFWGRVVEFFLGTKRRIAFYVLATYIFKLDGKLHSEEVKLLDELLDLIKLSSKKREALRALRTQDLKSKDIFTMIRPILNDRRLHVFAWQCILTDEVKHEAEIAFMEKLNSLVADKKPDSDSYKEKARRIHRVGGRESLKIYFNGGK